MTPLPIVFRAFARPIPLALFLAFITAIPVISGAVLAVQVPLGAVPEGSQRLLVAPVALGLHGLAGALFGLLGPLQFTRALRGRFGPLHRAAGYTFVAAGLLLGASGLALLTQVSASPLLDTARTLAGAALIGALILGLTTRHHRAWMIRAYALGMGSGVVGLVFLPIFLITGNPPTGLPADLIVTGTWALTILLAETLIRRLEARA
jgi:hypothetical protein